MNTFLLIMTWFAPLLAAPLALRPARWLLPLSALPGLFTALLVPAGTRLELPWLLLGTQLGLDDSGRLFLLTSALMWVASAIYAVQGMPRSPSTTRFHVFFQLAMAGNFALILAQDMVTFYLGFTLMGLSAYALVAHKRSVSARRAGSLYLRWTLLGEVSLFCALLLIAVHSGGLTFDRLTSTAPTHFTVALLILGFGIKLALPGLHLWLPPAYTAAPIAGAAVLSGPMISAGFLGWMRFLPPGSDNLSGWGEVLVFVGIAQSGLGIALGLVQINARAVLGYSSIAKMGILTAGFGVALTAPQSASTLIAVLALYAVHHLLVKGALFLGVGFLENGAARPFTLVTLVVLSLALAGAPLSSGALLKTFLSDAAPQAWPSLHWLLTASSVGSTLLMARFLYLVWQMTPRPVRSPAIAWTVWFSVALSIVVVPFVLADPQASTKGWETLLLASLAAASVWIVRPPQLSQAIRRISAGDVLHLTQLKRIGIQIGKHLSAVSDHSKSLHTRLSEIGLIVLKAGYCVSRLSIRWPLAGAVWLAITSLVYLSLVWV